MTPINITGSPAGFVVARDADGNQLASMFEGRDGWHVTTRLGKVWSQIFVETQAEAEALLKVVAEVIAS